MKYEDGTDVRVGDKVQLWEGCRGIVVCSMDTDEYSSDIHKREWSHLSSGVMIQTDKVGLFHYSVPDEDFQLIERGK